MKILHRTRLGLREIARCECIVSSSVDTLFLYIALDYLYIVLTLILWSNMVNTYTGTKTNRSRNRLRQSDNFTAVMNQLVINYNRKIRTVQGEAKKKEREAREKINHLKSTIAKIKKQIQARKMRRFKQGK